MNETEDVFRQKPLRLNYKRTFLIGSAFFSITLLWYVYNMQCPLILAKLFASNFGPGNYKTIIGVIMAMDNVAAIFMLPIFGKMSDKTNSKRGKRMPFIIIGMFASAVIFPFIILSYLWNSLAGVIVSMGLVIFFMMMYRAPSVALMPDCTPKPLRAKANGIINFVGYIGGIFGGILLMLTPFIFKSVIDTNTGEQTYFDPSTGSINLIWPFVITSILMLVALAILYFNIHEKKIETEMHDDMQRGEKQSETEADLSNSGKLTKQDKINLTLIICAEFFWFMGFNGVNTFWSTYCSENLNSSGYSLPSTLLIIFSLITFIPAGMLVSKIGRKLTIVIGIIICTACFATGMFFDTLTIAAYIVFALVGVGWAMINVASFPMIVEFSTQKTIGTYTSIYYMASMVAQSVTPILIGMLMDATNNGAFFPYATSCFGAALIVFLFVKNKRKTTANTPQTTI